MADPFSLIPCSLVAFCRAAATPGRKWDRLYWKADGRVSLERLVEAMIAPAVAGLPDPARSPPAIAKLLADWREGRVEMLADGGPDLQYGVGLVVPRGLALGASVLVANSEAEAFLCGWDYGEIGPRYQRPRLVAEAVIPAEPARRGPGRVEYDDSEILGLVKDHWDAMPEQERSVNGAVTRAMDERLKKLGRPIVGASAEAMHDRLRTKFTAQLGGN
jgi:hypothetical protein